MLAGLFGDLYHGGAVKNMIDIPGLIANVQTMFEASAKLQVVSSEEAASNNWPDWVRFKTAADEVRILPGQCISTWLCKLR